MRCLCAGRLKVKSDVYAFGIVVMEVLTGKRMQDIRRLLKQKSLSDWVKSNIVNRGKIGMSMDAKLEGLYPTNLALEVAQLGLKCIQTEVNVRPSMKEVVERLEQIEAANQNPAGNSYKRRRVNNAISKMVVN